MHYFRHPVNRIGVIAALLVSLAACGQSSQDESTGLAESTTEQPGKPNILWLVIEDMSPTIPAYGDTTIATPTISSLATEGVRYTHVYSPSGVCAPSRAALALGMYPSSIGANHMRTTSNTEETGLPKYEAVPPAEAQMLSQYLRAQGYYATNNLKNDYQFKAPKTAWDENGPTAHWRNRPEGKPFFSVVNFTTTHESGLFEPYGFREIESRHYFSSDAARIEKLPKDHALKTAEVDTAVHLPKDTLFSIPPYLPDTEVVRRDLWKMYNNLAEVDRQIGAVLQDLKDDGLYDNTIIFFYSDHGGPLPRQKRLIYDSGLNVPLIIRFPDAKRAGTVDDQLVSFVDFAPTTMGLAGLAIPEHMHGRDFIQNSEKAREFIHAAADRFDGFTDVIRAVRNSRFKYIRNYRPEQGYYLPVTYREKIPTMQELLRLRDAGQLNEVQMQWFRETKPREELFDTTNDPHELRNLAGDPEYADILDALGSEMDRWLANIGDTPNRPERVLIERLWQGSSSQPRTIAPRVSFAGGEATIDSATQGASIGYRIVSEGSAPSAWSIYQGPFPVATGAELQVVAHRIGFKESATKTYVENDGIVVIEAEDFAHQAKDDVRRWYRFDADNTNPQHRKAASGGAYIEILPDTRVTHDDELVVGENFTNKPGIMAVLSYPVHFNQPGRYYIWARAFSTGSEDNGVHFGLNGLWPESSARLQWCEGKHQWTWSSARRVPDNHCGDPLTNWIDVAAAGTHTLQISMREDGVELDKVILARDENFVPQDAGKDDAY